MKTLAPYHIERISEAILFHEHGVLPQPGGQDNQPLWLFDVVATVKFHYLKLQQLMQEEAQRRANAKT